jgi:hypothetical protein
VGGRGGWAEAHLDRGRLAGDGDDEVVAVDGDLGGVSGWVGGGQRGARHARRDRLGRCCGGGRGGRWPWAGVTGEDSGEKRGRYLVMGLHGVNSRAGRAAGRSPGATNTVAGGTRP